MMPFQKIFAAVSIVSVTLLSFGSGAIAGSGARGFDKGAAAAQKDLESRFDAALDAENLRSWIKFISARPHHIGTRYNKETADFIAAKFKEWGYDTKLERFDVLFPTPKSRLVEMTKPDRFTLRLNEPPVKGDPSTDQQSEQLPTYNAYS